MGESLLKLGKFDSIVMSHFVPDSEALAVLPHVVNERGIVLMESFAPAMKEQRDFSINLILDFEEMERALPAIRFLKKKSREDDRGFFNGCVFHFL